MKINFILPFKRMSGGIRVVYIYANYLTKQGHDVCCYLPMLSYKGKGQSLPFRIKASISNTIKKENWFECHFPVKVVPVIKDQFVRDADVVIATAWQTAYDVKKLNNSKGRKYYFVQGYETFNGEKEQVEATYQLDIPIITISKALQKKIATFSEKVEVIYNGLFDEEYIVGEKQKTEKFTVILMYHEASYRRTEDALNVVKKVKEMYSDIHVIVYGRKITESFPKDYEVLENPERTVLISAYQKADVFLFTSVIEAWGLPIVEAMANKCAVIGRKIGALDELYDGKNALIIEDVEEMVEQVSFLHDNREKLRKIQNAGFQTVKQLNWENAGKRFENLILNK